MKSKSKVIKLKFNGLDSNGKAKVVEMNEQGDIYSVPGSLFYTERVRILTAGQLDRIADDAAKLMPLARAEDTARHRMETAQVELSNATNAFDSAREKYSNARCNLPGEIGRWAFTYGIRAEGVRLGCQIIKFADFARGHALSLKLRGKSKAGSKAKRRK